MAFSPRESITEGVFLFNKCKKGPNPKHNPYANTYQMRWYLLPSPLHRCHFSQLTAHCECTGWFYPLALFHASAGKDWPCLRVGLYIYGQYCCCCPLSTFIFCCKIAHPAALLHHNLLTLRNEFLPFLFCPTLAGRCLKPLALIYQNFRFSISI